MIESTTFVATPGHFLCSMTLEIMRDPVQHKETKQTFERDVIMEWIYFGKATCPLTKKVLKPEDFVTASELAQEIEDWRQTKEWNELDFSATGDEKDLMYLNASFARIRFGYKSSCSDSIPTPEDTTTTTTCTKKKQKNLRAKGNGLRASRHKDRLRSSRHKQRREDRLRSSRHEQRQQV